MINEEQNGETQTPLEHFGFHSKIVDEAMDMLEWVARDTYEFEHITCASGCHFPTHVSFRQDHFMMENL